MIGNKQREAIRAAQEGMAALQAQVGTLDNHIAGLSARIDAQQAQAAGREAESAELNRRLAELDGVVETQAATIRSQVEALGSLTVAIKQLQNDGERREEVTRQVRTDLVRMERQAAIDLDEMRATSAAVAASVLLTSSLPGAAPEGGPDIS